MQRKSSNRYRREESLLQSTYWQSQKLQQSSARSLRRQPMHRISLDEVSHGSEGGFSIRGQRRYRELRIADRQFRNPPMHLKRAAPNGLVGNWLRICLGLTSFSKKYSPLNANCTARVSPLDESISSNDSFSLLRLLLPESSVCSCHRDEVRRVSFSA